MADTPSLAAAVSSAAEHSSSESIHRAANPGEAPIYAIGEKDAMAVNMRNSGLEQLNEKYMNHLRNTMRREVSLITIDQRTLLNRFNNYSMTMVSDSLVPAGRDRRSYLQYLKARQQQQNEGGFPMPVSAGSQDHMARARSFIESQRVSDGPERTDGPSLERLKMLTRPSRPYQTLCPRLKAAPVRQVHPEFAPSLRKARVRTAPTPSYLLRMHYQRIEEERQRESLPSERRAHSTLGFSVHDACLRRRVLEDSRFVMLRDTLVAPKQQPRIVAALEQEEL